MENMNMIPLLHSVLSRYGTKEVAGSESNPEILNFFKDMGYDGIKDDSTTAWCSVMLSYFAKVSGYEYHKGLDARGWLKMPIMVLKPQLGDIAILWRGSLDGWEGHVGLYIRSDENNIWILGGNQNNEINIQPYSRERLLGYRQLKRIAQ